jgi:hypothetical protein
LAGKANLLQTDGQSLERVVAVRILSGHSGELGMLTDWLAEQGRLGDQEIAGRIIAMRRVLEEVLGSLKAFRKGFIFDRFTNQLYCHLPDRETLYLVVWDKVKRVPGGNPLWAEKALLLADEMGVRTPRKVIGLLAGRDRLLTGDYQRDKLSIARRERAEREALAAAQLP